MPVIFQNSINSKFLKINFRNPLLYFLLAIKLLVVIGLNYFNETTLDDHWGKNTWLAFYIGDSHAYIKPIDNFISEGEYYMLEYSEKVYNGRAPYYGSIYYLLRQFAGYYLALDLLAFLQILADCFAGIVISVMVFRITAAGWTFWSTLLLYTISFYQTDYSGRILTESLANTALIFFSYFIFLLFNDKSRKKFFMAGLWLSIAVVLKPYFAPLYLIFLLFYDRSKTVFNNIYTGILISLSLLILILPFTIRNYDQFGIFQPFSSFDGGSGISEGDFAFRKYLQGLGESFVFWDPDCAGCLFTNMPVPCDYVLPERVFTANTDAAAFGKAREIYIEYLNNRIPEKEIPVIQLFNSMRDDYRESKPFMYYAGSRVLLLSRFIFQKASYYIPNPFTGSGYVVVSAIKSLQWILYYFITLTGLTGAIYFIFKNRKIAVLTGLVPFYLLLLFPVVLRAIEWRYWTNAHYFLIMSTVLFIFQLKKNYNNHEGASKSIKTRTL